MVTCKTCGDSIDELAVFPGGRCLVCWETTPEANARITSDQLVAMWGGKPRRRRA